MLDFAYFAFTIGTSLAVSDVEATDPKYDEAPWDRLPSFFYNAAS